MPLTPEDFRAIIEHTRVVRSPKQLLATFGATVLRYFVVTEPSYAGLPLAGQAEEAVVRTGKVTAAQPQIVTPLYLMNLFQGFEHGDEFARYLRLTLGPNAPGLMYSYRQEPGEMEMVSDSPTVVAGRIASRLDQENVALGVVITGVDQFWDVSLAHFIYALTAGSAVGHVTEMGQRGLFNQDASGIPFAARQRIESMFSGVAAGQIDGSDLKTELDRWGVFGEYEDRFLDLYRRRN